ncbi:hypothetical protein BC2230_120157 [Burkholderia cepacia]
MSAVCCSIFEPKFIQNSAINSIAYRVFYVSASAILDSYVYDAHVFLAPFRKRSDGMFPVMRRLAATFRPYAARRVAIRLDDRCRREYVSVSATVEPCAARLYTPATKLRGV